ncbi:hypothetical protein J3R30DRAFT_165094 [Lentinula aciculospora]|uniref:Uncharacterized protein n=1 Tax=Lentinula aciculospora TaxID=153920 RepID=A0A9W9AUU5_9AGAR|nr:hypothetical protein J3R30DRAFT_165094 [Lentinula aciculospora]
MRSGIRQLKSLCDKHHRSKRHDTRPRRINDSSHLLFLGPIETISWSQIISTVNMSRAIVTAYISKENGRTVCINFESIVSANNDSSGHILTSQYASQDIIPPLFFLFHISGHFCAVWTSRFSSRCRTVGILVNLNAGNFVSRIHTKAVSTPSILGSGIRLVAQLSDEYPSGHSSTHVETHSRLTNSVASFLPFCLAFSNTHAAYFTLGGHICWLKISYAPQPASNLINAFKRGASRPGPFFFCYPCCTFECSSRSHCHERGC